jgi:hypothetical protein
MGVIGDMLGPLDNNAQDVSRSPDAQPPTAFWIEGMGAHIGAEVRDRLDAFVCHLPLSNIDPATPNIRNRPGSRWLLALLSSSALRCLLSYIAWGARCQRQAA